MRFNPWILAGLLAIGLAACGQPGQGNSPGVDASRYAFALGYSKALEKSFVEALDDPARANSALIGFLQSIGGPQEFSKLLSPNPADEARLRAELERFGLNYELHPGSINPSSVTAQNIYDCVEFFPPEDRNKVWVFPVNLMSVTIDAVGRPVLATKNFPPLGLGSRDPACQRFVGNLFSDVPNSKFQGGHLIGDSLGGYGGRANLAPQNANFNAGIWRETEKTIRSCRLINWWFPAVSLNVAVSYPSTTTSIPDKWGMYGVVFNARKELISNFSLWYHNEPRGGPQGPQVLEQFKRDMAIMGCGQRGISLVVDDTGSMGSVIDAVKGSLASYISNLPEEEDIATYWNLTTFKDDVTSRGTTRDRSTVLAQVNSLYAWGGDDCPENVLGGILDGVRAFNNLEYFENAPKDLVVVTDASAQPGDVDGVIAAARLKGSRVHVLLTGDCGYPPAGAGLRGAAASEVGAYDLSSQAVLRRIAQETGGQYFYLPGGTRKDFTDALNRIFAEIDNPAPADTEPPTVKVSVTPSTLWPPNHKLVEVKPAVSASDNLDPTPRVELVGVKVSEPDDGQGDGNTDDDVQITANGRIFVRAERSAQGNRRVYTITYRATDASGNTGYGSADVVVPHDRSGK